MKVTINFSVKPELDDEESNYEIKEILKDLIERVNATRYNNGASYTVYNESGHSIGKMSVVID